MLGLEPRLPPLSHKADPPRQTSASFFAKRQIPLDEADGRLLLVIMAQVDLEFAQLAELIETFDKLITDVRCEADESPDPDALGVFDRGEAVVGLGFVACQNYLVARKKRRRKTTYDMGPMNGPYHIARIINEGANYWKHHAEWPPSESDFQPFQRPTAEVLKGIGVWQHDYRMLNLLELLAPDMRFATLLVSLDAWREALDPGGFVP